MRSCMRMGILFISLIAFLGIMPSAAQERIIEFAGQSWTVKDGSRKQSPGPNYFSDSPDMVWVDEKGYAHLAIRKIGNRWYSSEIVSRTPFGYGTYMVGIASLPEPFDPRLVAGFFTYSVSDVPYHQEIDIEFSQWGVTGANTGHFTVQPYTDQSNSFTFSVDPSDGGLFLFIEGIPEKVTFSVYHETPDGMAEKPFAEWSYDGTYVPIPEEVYFRCNLWLFQGKAPGTVSRETGYEMILSDFRFIPHGSILQSR